MLMQLRMSAEEAAAKRREKDALFASDIFELLKAVRDVEIAVDTAALGDESKLEEIFDAVLGKYTLYKGTRDKSDLVRKSKFMEVCELTLRELLSENIRPAFLVKKWGEFYAKALVLQNERAENSDSLRVKAEQMSDAAAASNDKIPTTVPKGSEYTVANLSVVATARRTIQLRSLPPQYEAVKFANGYLLHKQKILALDLEGLSRKKKKEKIANIILALRAKGHRYMNVLENRDPPFFHHKGNPLTFIWLMPVAEFSRTPLEIAQVQFLTNQEQEEEGAGRISNADKIRANREAFEKFLAADKQYAEHLSDAKEASAFQDRKGRNTAIGLAQARREELLKIWKGEEQRVELPDSLPAAPKKILRPRIGSRIGGNK